MTEYNCLLAVEHERAFDAHIICAKVNMWHDVAPGILLVKEAGGRVTDWNGNDVHTGDVSGGFVASNGKIHDQLLKIINGA